MNERFYFVCGCPICEQGLCRVRVCDSKEESIVGCVVCDECEATWTDPSLTVRFKQPSPEFPVFPQSDILLWGEYSRWADEDDLCELDWDSESIADP